MEIKYNYGKNGAWRQFRKYVIEKTTPFQKSRGEAPLLATLMEITQQKQSTFLKARKSQLLI